MPRVYIVVGLIIVALSVYATIDTIMTDKSRTRGLPKILWVLVILLLPVIGAALWFTLGKDRGKRGGRGRAVPRTTAPDDDPDFLRRINTEKEQEERIRRLEQELADLDDDPKPNDG
ncbi:PLDc N-terminal domain-containing protein [Marisediminicola sp. LYQ134]|uniref:PLDc N-terminal domain-containing protein n=1 Tax=unclassified Marisediminicola TaxID=2618316 RepID=UPI003983CDD3